MLCWITIWYACGQGESHVAAHMQAADLCRRACGTARTFRQPCWCRRAPGMPFVTPSEMPGKPFMAPSWLGGAIDAICSQSRLACDSFDIFCLSGTSSSCLPVWNLPCLGLDVTGL